MAADIVLGNSGVLAPGRYRWARALGWICILAILCVLSFNLAADAVLRVAAAMSGDAFTTRAAAPTSARPAAVILASITMLATYRLAIRFGERRAAPELGLRALIPELTIGIGIGTTLMGMIIAILWVVGWVSISTSPVTALSFGGLHLNNPDASLFAALCLVAGEGVGAGLYLLTGRIWASIGMHADWNFAQGWLFGGVISGIEVASGGPLPTEPFGNVAEMLSGGGFGPESSMAALGISLIASAFFLTIAWQRGRFDCVEG